MHRIDAPSATVEEKFTEGSPTGGVPATTVTADWLNDVQEELISILASAGVVPVKGTQDQVLKAIRKVSAGVVGKTSNLKASAFAAAATGNFSADEIVLESALGGLRYGISSFSQTINLGNVGPNGMDAGLAPASGYVAIYAICTEGGTARLLGVNATSGVAPPVYGGANMPSGYIASALISVLPTNASRQFKAFSQVEKSINIIPTQIFAGGTGGIVLQPFSLSAAVPLNAISVSGGLTNSSTTESNIGLTVSATNNLIGAQNISGTVVAGGGFNGSYEIDIAEAQTLYISTTNTAGTPTYTASVSRYSI